MLMKIHPTAVIDSKAELAEDVEVQPFTIIGPQVQIGKGSVVGPHCVMDGRTIIGENNEFFSGTQIGVICQDLKHDRKIVGRTEIGDGNTFREHVTISASAMPSYSDDHKCTTIGGGCLFMAYSHVGHDCQLGNSIIMGNCATLAGHVHVEDFAFFAGLSAVHQFCSVGTMAMIGGLAAVSKDAPPYMMTAGNPARYCGLNAVGLRRRGVDVDVRRQIKEMGRIMFRSGLNTTQALHEIERAVQDNPVRTHFLEFFRKSVRGVTR